MEQEAMKKVIGEYIQAYNSFDVDGMMALMHAEVAFQNISNGQPTLSTQGILELRAAADQASRFFKSRCQTVTGYQFGEDTATIDIDYTGELAADIPDGPKAGETIHLKGRSIFVFNNGLIIKLTDIS